MNTTNLGMQVIDRAASAFCYPDMILVIQLIAGVALFYSSFCRLTHTTLETITEIRMAIWAQSVAALSIIFCPFLPLFEPSCWWPAMTTPIEAWALLVASSAAIQIATARHWVNGIPASYIKPQHRTVRRRRSTDFESTMP